MNTLLIVVPIALAALCAYSFILRPVLHAMPAFKSFYDEADTFWGKVWAVCGKSATVAWSYFLGAIGAVWQMLDPIAQALGDPDLKAQIMDALKDHPQILSGLLIGIAFITIRARVRSIKNGVGK
jgi:hypothetical protein